MKKILALILAAVTLLSLASCQLSEIIPPNTETSAADNQSEGTTAGATTEEQIPEAPKYDFMGTDLTQFVKLCEYKGIELVDETVEVTDELLQRYVKERLVAAGHFEKKRTGTINEFDIVSMDYVGKLDGVAFSGGTASDVKFLVTENRNYIYGSDNESSITPGYGYIAGFANAMIGNDISKPFDINVKFPDDYGSKDLAGKAVVFTITINHILAPVELNETTLKDITSEKTVEDFLNATRKELEELYKDDAKNSMGTKIWEKLIKESEFSALPNDYVDGLFNSDFKYAEKVAGMYGVDVEIVLQQYYGVKDKDGLRENIIYSVKQMIIYYQILKNENLDLTDDEYKKRLDEIAKAQDTTAEEVEKLYTKEYILDVFRYEVVNEYIFEQCKITKPAA